LPVLLLFGGKSPVATTHDMEGEEGNRSFEPLQTDTIRTNDAVQADPFHWISIGNPQFSDIRLIDKGASSDVYRVWPNKTPTDLDIKSKDSSGSFRN
jgi:hypothetical protein